MPPVALPKAILWDWDNTLVDSWANIHRALEITFKNMGVEFWSLEETKKRMHKSLEDSFPTFFGDRWTEAGDMYRNTFGKIHLEKLTPLPGSADTLRVVTDFNIYTAVISNKKGELLRRESDRLSWDSYFSGVYGALDVPHAKPAPDLAVKALENSGIECGKDVWLIGDSLSDLRCAHATGCTPVLFGDPQYIDKEGLKASPPVHHVADHAALQTLLRSAA